MMATASSEDMRQRVFGYPIPKRGPDVPYHNPPKAKNPVLRGYPLTVAAFVTSNIASVAAYLWRNAGFAVLRTIRELDDYDPRYDPTVIPTSDHVKDSPAPLESSFVDLNDENPSQTSGDRHYSIADYHDAYKHGRLTPTAVAKAILAQLSSSTKYSPVFLDVRKKELLAAAEASTLRWKEGKQLGMLDGIPVAVKDEVDLSGCKTRLGSANDFTRADDATSWCVRQWELAGAVILGKLNMHEIGLDTTNNNITHGMPPNPHSPHHYPGGSSGGSASAVSLGLIPLALGADGGGSIRVPSSYCLISGLKPSHGRVSGSPTPSLAQSVGVLGPMAANVADVAIGYSVMATPDPSHPTSRFFPPPVTKAQSSKKIIGIYEPWLARADPAVLTLCKAAISKYQSMGWTVIPITIPFLPFGSTAHALTILCEISSAASSLRHRTSFTGTTTPTFSPANKILLAAGKQTPAVDFLLAQKMRNLLMQHLASIFKEYPDMIVVTPTTPNAGWRILEQSELKGGVSDADKSVRSMEYVWLANFTGCPAVSIPMGLADESGKAGGGVKVPVGLMGMGEWGNEAGLLEWASVGEEYMRADGDGDRRPRGEWVDVFKIVREAEGSEK